MLVILLVNLKSLLATLLVLKNCLDGWTLLSFDCGPKVGQKCTLAHYLSLACMAILSSTSDFHKRKRGLCIPQKDGKWVPPCFFNILKFDFYLSWVITAFLNTFTIVVHLVIMNIILVSSCSQSTSLSFTMKSKKFKSGIFTNSIANFWVTFLLYLWMRRRSSRSHTTL